MPATPVRHTIPSVDSSRSTGWKRILGSVLVAVVFFAGALLFVGWYVRWSKERWEKDERVRIMEVLTGRRARIENELFARIYYTRSVAAYVSLRPDIEAGEFTNLAAELIGDDPVINTMSLAPDSVIAALHPMEGHEAAIGLDLLAHPERREIVEQTIRSRKTFVAGPVELVEGGVAFISYTPIFDKVSSGSPRFWGMTDIVILFNELFEAAGLRTSESGVSLALRGVDGTGGKGGVFFGDPEVFEDEPVEVPIRLPDGEWILAGVPAEGWSGYMDQDRSMLLLMIGSATVISLLLGLVTAAFLKLRTSRSELRRLNEDKNRLLSVIAHDLRSPMAAISGLSSGILEGPGPLEEDSREMVTMIQASAEDSLFLLENLLSWIRSREEGDLPVFESIDAGELIESTLGSFRPAALLKGVRLGNEAPASLRIIFDARIVQTVLRNLVSNGIKFSEKGGKLTIGIDGSRAGPGRIAVVVKDEGVGMPQERAEEILGSGKNVAARGTSKEQGAGLGLVLCRDLLARCGERIGVESRPGVGTTVWFTLPRDPGREEPVPVPPRPPGLDG